MSCESSHKWSNNKNVKKCLHSPDLTKIRSKKIYAEVKQLSITVKLSIDIVLAKGDQDISPRVSCASPIINSLKRNTQKLRYAQMVPPVFIFTERINHTR